MFCFRNTTNVITQNGSSISIISVEKIDKVFTLCDIFSILRGNDEILIQFILAKTYFRKSNPKVHFV